MESIAVWQGATLGGIVAWILISSYLNVTRKLRSFLQPWVAHHVIAGTPLIFQIQKYQHWFFDALFSGLSCVVSVPFYTAFLPLLFWSGHGRLARQMTLLMAFCDYLGNTIKDMVSAPRPSSPPVRRITATKDEEDNALEYGLPSSHTLNTVCLSGYLGSSKTYHQFHHEAVAHLFTPQLTISNFVGRMLVGIPTILLVKFCSKALAKWILPGVSTTLGIRIKSINYIPTLNGNGKKSDESKQSGYIQRLVFSQRGSFDVDMGIRFIQYAGLAWSVVDLVPSLFSHLSL